jgi:hypothetical protein
MEICFLQIVMVDGGIVIRLYILKGMLIFELSRLTRISLVMCNCQ